MSISVRSFGFLPTGEEAKEYTLTCASGASASITDFGGTVTAICVPDKNGKLRDVAIGFPSVDVYHHGKSGSAGALIGRVGNRIGGAAFSLEGKEYPLDANNGVNCLHGGFKGWSKRLWNAKTAGTDAEPALVLTLLSPDGDQGFPGKAEITVTYTLTAQNSLCIHYHATTDAPTLMNMTNHSYFNLSGHGSGTILDHTLQINADYVNEADDGLIPTGRLLPCEETAFDFRKPTRIGDVIDRIPSDHALQNAGGVDFNYCMGHDRETKIAATLYSPESGISMDVVTDQPGVQCYTGQGLDEDAKDGVHYNAFSGVALETQHYPDSIHHAQFPSIVLRPQDTYDTFTNYCFSVR